MTSVNSAHVTWLALTGKTKTRGGPVFNVMLFDASLVIDDFHIADCNCTPEIRLINYVVYFVELLAELYVRCESIFLNQGPFPISFHLARSK